MVVFLLAVMGKDTGGFEGAPGSVAKGPYHQSYRLMSTDLSEMKTRTDSHGWPCCNRLYHGLIQWAYQTFIYYNKK